MPVTRATKLNQKEIKKLISLMKNEGVLKFKQGDLEIELSPLALMFGLKPGAASEEVMPQVTQEEREQAQEKNLFWSAPGGEIPEH